MITHWLVEATRVKIADTINGIIGKKPDRKGYERSPNNLAGERLEDALGKARHRATIMAGTYLAHARREVTYDEIEQVLTMAGGDPLAVQNLRATLVSWREEARNA